MLAAPVSLNKAIDKFYLDGEMSLLDLHVGTGDDKYECEWEMLLLTQDLKKEFGMLEVLGLRS